MSDYLYTSAGAGYAGGYRKVYKHRISDMAYIGAASHGVTNISYPRSFDVRDGFIYMGNIQAQDNPPTLPYKAYVYQWRQSDLVKTAQSADLSNGTNDVVTGVVAVGDYIYAATSNSSSGSGGRSFFILNKSNLSTISSVSGGIPDLQCGNLLLYLNGYLYCITYISGAYKLAKYDLNWNLITSINAGARSICTDGTYIYANNTSSKIIKVNPSNLTIVTTSTDTRPMGVNTVYDGYIYLVTNGIGGISYNGNIIYKYQTSDLTYITGYTSTLTKFYHITHDRDYIYANDIQATTYPWDEYSYIRKISQSGMTVVTSSPKLTTNYILYNQTDFHIEAPSGLTAFDIECYHAHLSWTNNNTKDVAQNVIQRYSGSTWIDDTFVSSGVTTVQIAIQPNTSTDFRVCAIDIYGYYFPSSSVTIDIGVCFPISFCNSANYNISGSTCGNSDGKITITNTDYFLFYDFTLTDIDGNSYTFNTTTGEATGLTSNYYFLTATVKPAYWYYYGRDNCQFDWIKIEDSDNTAYLNRVVVTPLQCQPFDVQYGRIYYEVSGLTSGNTFTFDAFISDLSNYYSQTGITNTQGFILRNAKAQCYWIRIVDEVGGCTLLLDNRCVNSIPLFSLSGIKKLWIAKWSDDLDYNYWSTADDDYFLEFEDTSFFTSTKIKEYLSLTGGTTGVTWYSLPVADKVATLGQKLNKVNQGFIFEDTLTFAITKADADKWTKMATIINPENKWIYVLQCGNGFYWTGGYRHGGRISAYKFDIGAREGDNGYALTISCQSENKLLTNMDEDYVINNIL